VKTLFSALFLLLLACDQKKEAADLVRETLDEARTDDRVVIQVRLDRAELPTADDLALRQQLEERIEREHVGRVVESKAEVGYFEITAEVDNTAEAVPRIRTMLAEAGVLDRTQLRVASGREAGS
jgi:hypothetical protein